MILDLSLFAWELDLLELRLQECADVVDQFVILEARETTRGTPRELVFPEHRQRFVAWANKIDYHVVGMPAADHPHRRFGRFRDLLANYIPDGAPNDIILVCDADEIPRASVLAELPKADLSTPWALGMACYYYWFTLRFRSFGADGPTGGHGVGADGWPIWRGPAVCRRSTLERTTPNYLREGPALPLIPNGGWHLSFFGSVEENLRKLASQGHIEHDCDDFRSTENLEEARRLGRDFDKRRNLPLEWVELDSTYPSEVLNNRERWAKHIGPMQSVST